MKPPALLRSKSGVCHDILLWLISFSLDVSPPAAKVAFWRKISEDRYQFGRLTVLKKTTPAPRGVLNHFSCRRKRP